MADQLVIVGLRGKLESAMLGLHGKQVSRFDGCMANKSAALGLHGNTVGSKRVCVWVLVCVFGNWSVRVVVDVMTSLALGTNVLLLEGIQLHVQQFLCVSAVVIDELFRSRSRGAWDDW